MQARLLCVSSGNPLTLPAPERYENARVYQMAPPGKLYYYGESDCEPQIHPLRGASDYGLVVIENVRVLSDNPLSMQKDLVESYVKGEDRGRDLARKWMRYGCVMMAGAMPSAQEMEQARKQRLQYAKFFVQKAIHDYKSAQAGKPGLHAEYQAPAEAWSEEIGVALPTTIDSLTPSVPQSAARRESDGDDPRVACPECAEEIKPAAKKCRYCGASWNGKSAGEFAAAGELEYRRETEELLKQADSFDGDAAIGQAPTMEELAADGFKVPGAPSPEPAADIAAEIAAMAVPEVQEPSANQEGA